MKKIFTFLLLLLLSLGKITQVSAQAANVQDSLVLVNLYDSTGGPNWTNNSGWLKGPVSMWFGIELDYKGRVKSISLPVNNLIGNIPISLGNLDDLTYLVLAEDTLEGDIPSSLGNLTNLDTLHLGYNRLEGSIPSSLGNLANLIYLDLEANRLGGAVPSSLENLTHLTSLVLDFNKLNFDGLEEIAHQFGNVVQYSPQANIQIHQEGYKLSVDAGGTLSNNTYQWVNLDGPNIGFGNFRKRPGTNPASSERVIYYAPKVGDSTFNISDTGRYHVTVTNSIANELTLYSDTVDITSISAPVASFTLSKYTFNSTRPDTISITNTSTGNPTSFTWTVSDGAAPVVYFRGPGFTSTYPITFIIFMHPESAGPPIDTIYLIATNQYGSDTAFAVVTEANTNPELSAKFSVSQNTITAGGTITTTNNSTGNPTSYLWSVSPSSGVAFTTGNTVASPSITFSSTGTYVITLKVFNANDSSQVQTSITVGAQPTYSISGTVINPTFSDLSGGIQNIPISCQVEIYKTGTTTIVDKTTSDNNGNFSFNGLKDGNYDVLATVISNGITYSAKQTNIAINTSGVQLKVPAGIIEQIQQYNDTLGNLMCHLDNINSSILVGSYDMYASEGFMASHLKLVNDDDIILDKLEMLCLAERVVNKYYEQAAALQNVYVSGADIILNIVFDFTKVSVPISLNLGEVPGLSKLEEILGFNLNDFIQSQISTLKQDLEGPISSLNSSFQQDINISLDMAIDAIENDQISLEDNIYDQDPTFRQTLDQILTDNTLKVIYVNNTSAEVTYISTTVPTINSFDIPTVIGAFNDGLYSSEKTTGNVQAKGQSYLEGVGWVNKLQDGVDEFKDIISNTFKIKIKYLKYLTAGLKALNLGNIAMAMVTSTNREGDLPGELRNTINSGFARKMSNQYDFHAFDSRISADKVSSIHTIVHNFENSYDSLTIEINRNDTQNIGTEIATLIKTNNILNDSVTDLVNNIKAAFPFSGLTDSIYFADLRNTLFASPSARFSQLINSIYYAQEPNDTSLDSLNAGYGDMVEADSLMLIELANMANNLSNVSSPAYISVSKSGIPLNMLLNTDTTVTVRFKNYGSTAASGVYAKIQIDTPFTASVDSVYIGNLNAEQQDSLTFTIQAPLADTFSHYTIHFFANSAITNPLGGTIFSRTPTLYNLSSSNFNVSVSAATCVGSNDGAINVIADSSLAYTATLSNNTIDSTYSFTDTLAINNLTAGTYELCLSVNGEPGYQQCYTLTIAQPKPLSAYAVVNPSQHTITLNMDGGHIYYIQLGHQFYTTSNNEITLPLTSNEHLLMISTDKACQGIVRKQINIPDEVMSYPNPFNDYLNIDFGKDNVANAIIKITELSSGRVVYDERVENQSGTMQLNTSDFSAGIYALDIYFNNIKYAFKIVKVEK